MTKSIRCPECDKREIARHVEEGECRRCRGVERPSGRRPGYVSPDRAERAPEIIDQTEQHARHRTITGGWGHGR